MIAPDDRGTALDWVHRGWDHLRAQRPLAAWAAWQRALRLDPEDRAARTALETLAAAESLPAAARMTYRFRPPGDAGRRARWDEAFRGRDLEELGAAAGAFAGLATADPEDASAHFNLGLCCAWLGRNAEAIAALDRFVSRAAATDFDAAVDAWTLAEVLRQGAGAEGLADDLGHRLEVPRGPADGDPIAWLATFARLRPSGVAIEPGPDAPDGAAARAFEWLDRPMPEADPALTAAALPRVLAAVLAIPGALRFSGPSAANLRAVERAIRQALDLGDRPLDARSTPLPLTLLDAAVGLVRLPEGLDEPTRGRLVREAVESYYENAWIFIPRHGLGGLLDGLDGDALSPRDAGLIATDRAESPAARQVARAKLEAIIRLRAQLAARPASAPLYGGYPFDRLRRRLGLEPHDPTAVETSDLSCMSFDELSRLDPKALDPAQLVEAYRSMLGIEHGERDRFAIALVERDPLALLRADPPELARDVVFAILNVEGPRRALDWIDRIIRLDAEHGGGRLEGPCELWRGAVLERAGRAEEAARHYRGLLERFPDDPDILWVAAAALLDRDEAIEAVPLLRRALELAERAGDRPREGLARAWLARLVSEGNS